MKLIPVSLAAVVLAAGCTDPNIYNPALGSSPVGASKARPSSSARVSQSPQLIGTWIGVQNGEQLNIRFVSDTECEVSWKLPFQSKAVKGFGGWSTKWQRVYVVAPKIGYQQEFKISGPDPGGRIFLRRDGKAMSLYKKR